MLAGSSRNNALFAAGMYPKTKKGNRKDEGIRKLTPEKGFFTT